MKSFRYVSPIELLSVLQTKTLVGDWYSSQKPGMALAFQVREELSAIKSSWKNDRVGFIINQFKRGDIETQEIGEKRRA
jgi:hypothetical protein